jgi:hypothetical protein
LALYLRENPLQWVVFRPVWDVDEATVSS